jgi:hypothetical protein
MSRHILPCLAATVPASRLRRALVFGLVAFLPTTALASDGVLEINQSCAVSSRGCFAGDAGGFPVTITPSAPNSSFRLTGDLSVGAANSDAVIVSRPGTSLDLGGFQIQGPNTCTGTPTICVFSSTGDGVSVSDAALIIGVDVAHGGVTGMGSTGIALGDEGVVRDVRVSHSQRGIVVGEGGLVSASTASLHARAGITVGDGGVVTHSTSTRNGGSGIVSGIGGSVLGCTVSDNQSDGIAAQSGVVGGSVAVDNGVGIRMDCCGVVAGSTAYLNAGGGIVAGGIVRDASSFQNGDAGIELSDYSLFVGSSLRDNAIGIPIGPGSAYRANAITSNDALQGSGFGVLKNLGLNFCTDAANATVVCPSS